MDATTINDAATMRGGLGSVLGRIDQYELVRELGGGGFGTVYLAKDTVAGIEVAVKGLPPIIKNNAEELERIRENFALVSRLHHPYIAAALHLQLAKDVAYRDESVRQKLRVMPSDTLMVMEYAPGVTLSKWRRQFPHGKVPLNDAIQLVWQIAQALDYAHEQHIIHRDIKPSNIMVETKSDGEVVARLLDFGLAAEIRSSMGRVSREIHDTSGTRPYMAPEQWEGRKQGPATDQYALAVLLCELFTGEVPFASAFETGDPIVMMTAVCNREVELPDDCPRKAALRTALAKEPEGRFASCMEFVEAAAKSERTTPQGGGTQVGRSVGLWLVVGVAAVAVAIGGILLYVHRQNELAAARAASERARIIAAQKAEAERKAQENARLKAEADRKAEATRQFLAACREKKYDDAAKLMKSIDIDNADVQFNLGKMYDYGRGVLLDGAAAVKWYRKAADHGNANALFELGTMYENGAGVAKDNAEAEKWYRMAINGLRVAAEKGDSEAQWNLGTMYENGAGVAKDYVAAVKWYRKAAEQGCDWAQSRLGGMYADGRGVATDKVTADKWYCMAIKGFREAAEHGDASAQNELGRMYEDGKGVAKDEVEAVRLYRKAAELGYREAKVWLGMMYEDGRGVVKDEAEAVKWFRKAAEEGDDMAQTILGRMYADGKGVAKDGVEAVKLYRKAAEQGNVIAQCNLGEMYLNGRGVAKDEAEAAKWFRKAAEEGDDMAQTILGRMYEDGKGVAKDEHEAIKWYRKAAEQGNADAQFGLAVLYENGRGVAKDKHEAVKWYRMAADQGVASAQTSLGGMYLDGWGVKKDEAEAVRWFRKAADQGYVDAQNLIGRAYEEGWGVTKDYCEAIKWFRKAAEQGHAVAQYNLGVSYEAGLGVSKNKATAIRWFRKAADQGYEQAKEALKLMESAKASDDLDKLLDDLARDSGRCFNCSGTGSLREVISESRCQTCQGTGRVERKRLKCDPCELCEGRGVRIFYKICPTCCGEKWDKRYRTIDCPWCRGTGKATNAQDTP